MFDTGLIRNWRKTDCGAIGTWLGSEVRAAPFALLRNGILCSGLGMSLLCTATLRAADPPCDPTTTERLRSVACSGKGIEGHPVLFSTYRGLEFGMSLTAVVAQAGTKPTDVRVVHKTPAMIQDLDWRPRPTVTPGETGNADPVKEGVL